MPSGVVSATCSGYGKSSSRFDDAGGAAEVVDRDGLVPALGEAERELLVEVVEPAHVREDDDPGRGRLVGMSRERGEVVAVGCLEHEILVRDGRARDHRDRRRGVEVEAHGRVELRGRRVSGKTTPSAKRSRR